MKYSSSGGFTVERLGGSGAGTGNQEDDGVAAGPTSPTNDFLDDRSQIR